MEGIEWMGGTVRQGKARQRQAWKGMALVLPNATLDYLRNEVGQAGRKVRRY